MKTKFTRENPPPLARHYTKVHSTLSECTTFVTILLATIFPEHTAYLDRFLLFLMAQALFVQIVLQYKQMYEDFLDYRQAAIDTVGFARGMASHPSEKHAGELDREDGGNSGNDGGKDDAFRDAVDGHGSAEHDDAGGKWDTVSNNGGGGDVEVDVLVKEDANGDVGNRWDIFGNGGDVDHIDVSVKHGAVNDAGDKGEPVNWHEMAKSRDADDEASGATNLQQMANS